ncbi:MAG: hypothetical protein ABSG16_03470 [Candidatus Acidiferrum sp.]
MRRSLPPTLLAALSLFLFSCAAKQAPEQITVVTPEAFTGKIKIMACVPSAPADRVIVDASGKGQTSICAASPDLKVVVLRGQQTIEVPARVTKTGDDFVVSISAEVPGN